jgi:hypothetical protein
MAVLCKNGNQCIFTKPGSVVFIYHGAAGKNSTNM